MDSREEADNSTATMELGEMKPAAVEAKSDWTGIGKHQNPAVDDGGSDGLEKSTADLKPPPGDAMGGEDFLEHPPVATEETVMESLGAAEDGEEKGPTAEGGLSFVEPRPIENDASEIEGSEPAVPTEDPPIEQKDALCAQGDNSGVVDDQGMHKTGMGAAKVDADAGAVAGADTGADAKRGRSKREINKDFQDVQKTGKWGSISKVEMAAVSVVSVLIVIGVVVAVAVVLGQENSPAEELVPQTTLAPTAKATDVPAEEKFSLILDELQSNNVTKLTLANLSEDPSAYEGLPGTDVCAQSPHECAMGWSLYADDFSSEVSSVVDRFALAALYYSLSGEDWKNSTNWLSSNTSHCDWYGVNCNRLDTEVEEIDLSENSLHGTIPVGLALIDTLAILGFKQNQITGSLPGDVVASLPQLFVLYIEDNLLTGPIPPDMINEEESLAVLHIHGNNFTGPFPENYCTSNGAVFRQLSVDCAENSCPEECCKSEDCY